MISKVMKKKVSKIIIYADVVEVPSDGAEVDQPVKRKSSGKHYVMPAQLLRRKGWTSPADIQIWARVSRGDIFGSEIVEEVQSPSRF